MSLTISPAQIVEESGSPLLAALDSWERRPLGEVASILNGFAFKSKRFVPAGGKPLIRIRDIFDENTAVSYVGDYDSRYLVQPDDLLVGMDGDFNCARWRGPEALLNQRVCKVTPDPEQLDLDFLTHLLPGYLQAIHDLTSSTTVTHLSSRDVAQIPIPVPPLDEQRELARLFDAAGSKQQSSAAHLAAARRAIERFCQAVLATACSGQLTVEWREEHASLTGHDVLARIAAARSNQRKVESPRVVDPPDGSHTPSSWAWASLGSVISELRNGISKAPAMEPPGLPILRISATRALRVDLADRRYLRAEPGEWEQFRLKDRDLLFTRYNGSIALLGVCGMVRGLDQEFLLYPDKLMRVRFDHDLVLPEYAELFFASPRARARIISSGVSSAGQHGISGASIKAQPLAVPPVEEQREIVRRVDQLLALADGLKQRIETASRRVETSSQAVRAKAFRGDLIANGTAGFASRQRVEESA